MKIFFTTLVILFGIIFGCNFVLAAKKYVPTPQQLQPPPPNVEPNLSGNINFIDKNSDENFQESGEAAQNNIISDPVKKTDSFIFSNVTLLPNQNTTTGKILWWLIIFGLAGGGTWLVKKRYPR